jgi:hypothetical protein
MVAGLNKLVPTLAEALDRSRVVAAVREACRVGRTPPCTHDGVCRNYECYPPERQRGKVLILGSHHRRAGRGIVGVLTRGSPTEKERA